MVSTDGVEIDLGGLVPTMSGPDLPSTGSRVTTEVQPA